MLGRFVFRYAPMRRSQVFPPQVVKLSAVKNYTISLFVKQPKKHPAVKKMKASFPPSTAGFLD